MSWFRSRRVWIVAAALVVVVAASAYAVRGLTHDPHEEAFQKYIGTSIDGWSDSRIPHAQDRDREWAEAHPDAILAEGRRSCDWLAGRPDAPATGDPQQWGVTKLEGTYLHGHAPTGLKLHEISRRFVTTGAWLYLCHDVRDRKTSHVDPNPD
jgi:hypothetical protein